MDNPDLEPVVARLTHNSNNQYARLKQGSLHEYFVFVEDPTLARNLRCITLFDGLYYMVFAHLFAISRRFQYVLKQLKNSFDPTGWIPMEPGSELCLRRNKIPTHLHQTVITHLADDDFSSINVGSKGNLE